MQNTILKAEKLSKSFSNSGNQQHVLKNLDLEIAQGEFTVIMGSSGSGKTTLLYALSGMDRSSLGKVIFNGQEIQALSNEQLAAFRRENCGFVFQNIHLLESMSVLDNVLVAGMLKKQNKAALVKRAKQLLEEVGINDALWCKFPSQLSGGERQRAGIVRAVINSPKILFADEPTGALNSGAGSDVLDIISKLHAKGQTVMMVTHDIKSALRGQRIIFLRDGKIAGELPLPPYVSEDVPARISQITAFLDEMGW